MRRILVFSTNYIPAIGGAEVAVKEITDRLPDSKFDLITARLDKARPKEEKIGKVSVYRVGFGFSFDKYLLPFLGFFLAVRLHKKNNYGLVWAVMASYGGIAAAFFKKLHGKTPMILTLQEGDEEKHLSRYVFGFAFLYKIFIRPWYRLPLRQADFITAISKHLSDRAREVSKSVPVEIVPNGVDVEKFSRAFGKEETDVLRMRFGFKPNDILILSVSRLVSKNGLGDLINAAVLLPENYKVLIVGEGELRHELEKEIFGLGLSGRVVLAGAVRPDEVPLFMKSADVFVRPSLSEGFGNVFAEAFAADLPAVATPVGGILDFLEDKETGVFCGVSDPTDIALKIGMVVKDVVLRKNIIKNAGSLVREKYDWGKIAEMMEGIFKKISEFERRRILIATGIYPPQIGGSAEYAFNLKKTFGFLGHRAWVVKYGSERVLPSGLRHVVFLIKCLFSLRGADFVLALDNGSAAGPAAFAAWLGGKKFVVRVGGDFLWEQYVERTGNMISLPDFNKKMPNLSFKEKIIFRSVNRIFKRADAVVFSSGWLADIFSDSYVLPKSKIKIVENFYGPKQDSVEPVKKNFIWAGRGIKLKNLAGIKSAFALAREQRPEIELEVVRYSHNLLIEKIKSAYATISVSLSEVSPNFVIESVYCGKPFITTKYCGIKDRLEDAGLYVDPLDTEDIVEKILYLAEDKHYADLVKNNRSFDFTHSWEEIAGEFLEIVSEK